MRLNRTLGILCVALLGISNSVKAQEYKPWEFFGTFYLWGPETKSTISTPATSVESTLKFSDALENLDFALMSTLEARHTRWSFIADYALTDLSFSNPSPDPAFGGINAKVKTQIFNGYVLYQIHEDQNVRVDVGGGLRWFDTDATLTLLPGALAGNSVRSSENWIDPLIAARLQFPLTEKWSAAVFVDFGGFSDVSESWQGLVTIKYAINDKWSLIGGYRHLDVSHGSGGNRFGFVQSGPLFGATFAF